MRYLILSFFALMAFCKSAQREPLTLPVLNFPDTTFLCTSQNSAYNVYLKNITINISKSHEKDSNSIYIKITNNYMFPIYLGITSLNCNSRDSSINCIIFPDFNLHEIIVLEKISRNQHIILPFTEDADYKLMNLSFYIIRDLALFYECTDKKKASSSKNTLFIHPDRAPETGFYMFSFYNIPLSKWNIQPIVFKIQAY